MTDYQVWASNGDEEFGPWPGYTRECAIITANRLTEQYKYVWVFDRHQEKAIWTSSAVVELAINGQ